MVQVHDPLMIELCKKLPHPDTHWPIDQRLLWLQACEGVLNLIYGPVEKIDITVTASATPRPPDIPTNFEMICAVLEEAGPLTARAIVAEVARRWWPGMDPEAVRPSIHGFVGQGRLVKYEGGLFGLPVSPISRKPLMVTAMEPAVADAIDEFRHSSHKMELSDDVAGACEVPKATQVAPEPEKRTSEPPADRETASEPESAVPSVAIALKPVTSAKAPKGNRPADIPSNLAMAVEAIKTIGPTGAAGIRNWCRRRFWPDMPDAWSAALYDLVNAGKLRRVGINFDVPLPLPGSAKPNIPETAKAIVERESTPSKAPLAGQPQRKVAPPVKHPAAPPAPRAAQGVKFEHDGRSVELGGREYVLAGKLRVAMGKGHVAEAFLAQTVMGSNTESARDAVKSVCLGMNDRLAKIGLKIEFYAGLGLLMKELS